MTSHFLNPHSRIFREEGGVVLDHEQNRRLEILAAHIRRSDPQFAKSLENGQPCAPCEYRRRSRATVAVFASAALVPMLFGHTLVGVVLVWIMLPVSVLFYGRRLDLPPRRRPFRG
jgi:hypothetical protein